MKRLPVVVAGCVAAIALLAVSSTAVPAAAAAPQRYRDAIFTATARSTYTYKVPPSLVTGKLEPQVLDVYQPVGDTLAARPAIVWIHGGGFHGGDRSALTIMAREWAAKGYVTMSIEYRLDSRAPCQKLDGDPVWARRCTRAIDAAQADALTAVAWLKARAKTFRVDPTRVAVGGGSAGAITAVNVGQQANPNGGPVPANVKVRAVLAMSGCNYERDTIDADDAPVSFLASGKDSLVAFRCVTATADAAQQVGTPVQRIFYPSESGHSQTLYRQHQPTVEARWEAFLIVHLDL